MKHLILLMLNLLAAVKATLILKNGKLVVTFRPPQAELSISYHEM
jgi:hypothetical protein